MQNVEKSRFPWWIVIAAIAVLALLVGALILFFVLRGNDDNVNVNVNKPNSAVKANKTKAKADAPTPAPTPSFEGTWGRKDKIGKEFVFREVDIQKDGDLYTITFFGEESAQTLGPYQSKLTSAGTLQTEEEKEGVPIKTSLKMTGPDQLTVRLTVKRPGSEDNIIEEVFVRE